MTPEELDVAVGVAQAALAEVGLAATFWEDEYDNGVPVPFVGWEDWKRSPVLHARALVLGHRAVGHDASVEDYGGEPGVCCPTCFPEGVAP